jgi:hypothetical protein
MYVDKLLSCSTRADMALVKIDSNERWQLKELIEASQAAKIL